ncbi:ABC transporter ATP-binding protein [Paenibacillus sp. FSL H7-0716]|jgi:putative ABC transport system ATP-binding protein|uniref:Macrolide ABC transporter ATP-binding protein n=1 Tax=Paenibacillus odorifer TaxID=189426 RepID=A0AB36JCZ3_9BACL|nr:MULTISPECIES: ABC transporter ATP-binding protein [Paenibacillus]MDH6426057.1 putative ABC transport system ATP-binding protein [Paenibacillus sp. PastH-4]MDH6442079.1 putative ABC transport system ATP-binding protein [Paenibacillus sp. PastF-4]MDH6527207.1 putative ABC transport system ATP-binding protein [Paenibacillus sp. PastH-3]OMC75687.1 macrolide ABC transporter ATP-binding protein [Paenibacillus odorifer]OMD69785.1 macrolide ABC transporter ATP-binding protein [Paenibacillus odorife
MSASAPLIEVHDMSHGYTMAGETMTVLNSLSFTIDLGEFVAIIGPSGSGKSTLMNMLGCLDISDEGSYLLDGQEVRKLSDNKLATIRNEKIGFIFQNFNLLPKLSAIENVELPLIYRGLPHRERRQLAQEALIKVGLEDRMHHRPSELSGGQQQRVAIARAMAGSPPILLADEPTGALDTRTGQEVMQMIRELNKQGHTIILITHDLEIAKQAERIIRIQDGNLVEDRRNAG